MKHNPIVLIIIFYCNLACGQIFSDEITVFENNNDLFDLQYLDIENDNNIELLVSQDSAFKIIKQTSPNEFQVNSINQFGNNGPFVFKPSDLNNDSFTDIVIGNESELFGISYNDSGGNFNPILNIFKVNIFQYKQLFP